VSTAPPPSPRPGENKILAALRGLQIQRFISQAESVSLAQGEVVYEADSRIEYVYFPETAVFSMLATMEDGSTVEVGPVGDEGLVGLRLFLGADTSRDRVLVHVAGTAMRLSADCLREELRAGDTAVPRLLTRYTQMLLAMTGQSGACYKLHSLEQQFSRWLLTMRDYVGDDLYLTHDLMALTLGVRRAGITEAAIGLKAAKLITYHRGHIKILDRQGLEATACACYREIKDEYDLLYADLSRHSV
jgi:CRP-like cAMP-binding protein